MDLEFFFFFRVTGVCGRKEERPENMMMGQTTLSLWLGLATKEKELKLECVCPAGEKLT